MYTSLRFFRAHSAFRILPSSSDSSTSSAPLVRYFSFPVFWYFCARCRLSATSCSLISHPRARIDSSEPYLNFPITGGTSGRGFYEALMCHFSIALLSRRVHYQYKSDIYLIIPIDFGVEDSTKY